MSHFLARASAAGPPPGDTLLFIARFHPTRGESGKAFSEESTHSHTQTEVHTHAEKSQALSGSHTHTHTLPGLVLSIRQDPEHVLLGLMFAFLPRAASLPAFKVSVFRDVPPGAGEIYIPFLTFFRRKPSRFFWPRV